MLRFAPSPTSDMDIGNLRVALLNYIVSKQRDENFIVRIEDIDKEKNIEGKDQEILDTLALFGIQYSQVIYQNQNVRFHTAMALQLIHEKKAFSCFCSDNWLDKKRKEAKQAKKEYCYDDACRNLPAELVIDNTSPFTIRINRPDTKVVLKDKIQNDISREADAVDSFIIMNQDKTPTYNFASAVDDMLSDISLIIRDEKSLENSFKQDHIRSSLAYDKKIAYAHIPTLIDADTISVKWLLEEGFLPEAISNYLISVGNKLPTEIFTMQEAVKSFSLENISPTSIQFDMNILRDLNRKYLKNLDAKELSRYVGFADEEIGELARVYLDEVATTKELKSLIAPIFAPKDIPTEFAQEIKQLREFIQSAPYFDKYEDFKNYIMKESGFKEEECSKALQLLFTNTEHGPDLAKIYKYLKNYIGEIIK